MRTKIKQITKVDVGQGLTVKGWVKSVRRFKHVAFIELNDGSSFAGLQVVVDASVDNYEQLLSQITTGSALCITGKLVATPEREQTFELHAQKIDIIGMCDVQEYPLQKKHHTLEFLRTIAHLRPRTNTFGAIARIRNALSFATHLFFQEHGFLYITTPLIVKADCEGAGQLFTVTTLDLEKLPKTKKGNVDFEHDFFEKQTYLTVSGQLNVECYACALSDVYAFGPTFRADPSETTRHLAEFWMVEPEMAFADLQDDMDYAEKYVKFCVNYALEKCIDDIDFLDRFFSKGLTDRLHNIIKTPFERMDYTKAIEILQKASKKFIFTPKWGDDLQSEHERYLVEEYAKRPVFVYNYPEKIKAFYMRRNDDGKTVAAMDLLVAGIGELIGGSQREERYEILKEKMKQYGISYDDYWWYLELRKYGSVPHAGFGLGFERLVMLVTGMENIRDVIPFPRYRGYIDF
jgi:asparaginyl-tRNA synthetase